MKSLPIFTILMATATLYPALLHAAPLQARHHGHWVWKARPARRENLTLAYLNLTPRTVLARPYGRTGWAPGPQAHFTAVSERISPEGPVASVGLVRFEGRGGPDAAAPSNALAGELESNGPTRRLGMRLSYVFR